MGKYRISRKAVADLDGIWEYTVGAWSEEQAASYYRQIYTSIQSLPDLPDYLERKYDAVKAGLFGYRVGHHVIFYKRHLDGTVWVDRILHERMDFQRHF
jgi:toxin ParE1/3/4